MFSNPWKMYKDEVKKWWRRSLLSLTMQVLTRELYALPPPNTASRMYSWRSKRVSKFLRKPCEMEINSSAWIWVVRFIDEISISFSELERVSMKLHNQITPFQSKFHLHFPWIVCAFPRRRKMESPRQRWWSWTTEESRTTFWTRVNIRKSKFQFSNFVLQPNRFGRQQYFFSSVFSACDSNCQTSFILWQTVICHKSRKQSRKTVDEII